MKYSVDRIESEIVILEDLSDKSTKEVNINKLPNNIKETDIVIYRCGRYKLDNKVKKTREDRLRKMMDKLKNN